MGYSYRKDNIEWKIVMYFNKDFKTMINHRFRKTNSEQSAVSYVQIRYMIIMYIMLINSIKFGPYLDLKIKNFNTHARYIK